MWCANSNTPVTAQDILSRKNALRLDFISKLIVPAIIVCVLIFCMEIIFAILRATLTGDLLFASYMSSAVYLIISFCVGVYFLVVGAILIKFLRKGLETSRSAQAKQVVQRTTASVIAMSICNLGFAISAATSGTHSFLDNPFAFRTILFFQAFTLACGGLVSVLSIRAPFGNLPSDRDEAKESPPAAAALGAQSARRTSLTTSYSQSQKSMQSSSGAYNVDTTIIYTDDD